MQTTYRLTSAQELTVDFIDKIKKQFLSKPLIITVEEEEVFELTQGQIDILDERLKEDKSDYISAEESLLVLKKKYGL